MIDLSKEIIYRDGVTLDNGLEDLTGTLLSKVGRMCDLGRSCGLSLNDFAIDSEMVYLEWRGSKGSVLQFYRHYCEVITFESPEKRKITEEHILNK